MKKAPKTSSRLSEPVTLRGTADSSQKQEKLARVAEATVRHLAIHGVESLTFAKIARVAQVSRPWLYLYVGKSREALVDFAMSHVGTFYASLDHHREVKTRRDWLASQREGFKTLLDYAKELPWAAQIYFRYKGTPTDIGRKIEHLETRYVENRVKELRVCFPELDDKSAKAAAELLMTSKLAFAHRWSADRLWGRMSKDEFAALLAKALSLF
ncbi:MAG: TetR/AcrR family transcriptional regulator [Oligoflexia bacterium]|nr:TetR/AcrR family transcriptional regulator [Oligoflexia bacterium]